MKTIKRRARVEVESGSVAYSHSIDMRESETINLDDCDPMISLADLSVHSWPVPAADGGTSVITYDDDPIRAHRYRFWLSEVRRCKREIRKLRASVTKAYFRRLVARHTRAGTARKWDGSWRIDRHYDSYVASWPSVYEVALPTYYDLLLKRRANDAKARAWLESMKAQSADIDVTVPWSQDASLPAPSGAKLLIQGGDRDFLREHVTYRPRCQRVKRLYRDWTKIHADFQRALRSRDKRIAVFVRYLKTADHWRRHYAFSRMKLTNNRCFQESLTQMVNLPPTKRPEMAPWGPFGVPHQATAWPSDISMPDPPDNHTRTHIAEIRVHNRTGRIGPKWLIDRYPSCTADQFSEYMGGVNVCPNLRFDREKMVLVGFRKDAFHDRLSDQERWDAFQFSDEQPGTYEAARLYYRGGSTREWQLDGEREHDPNREVPLAEPFRLVTNMSPVTIRSLNEREMRGALQDAERLNLARLLALDVPERRRTLSFNLARSVGELKDSPDTVKSAKDFIDFVRSRIKENFVCFEFGPKKSRIALLNAPDPLVARCVAANGGRPLKLGAFRFKNRDLGTLRGRVIPVATATVPQLAALYLAWKFGVSQTMSDIEAVTRYGFHWAVDCRRGLSQILDKITEAQPFHVIGRSFRVPSSVALPAERRAPKGKNGLRPFLSQSADVSYVIPPSVTVGRISFDFQPWWDQGGMFGSSEWSTYNGDIPVVVADGRWPFQVLPPDVATVVLRDPTKWAAAVNRVADHNRTLMREYLKEEFPLSNTEVVTALSATGRHWGTWSLGGIQRAVGIDRIAKTIVDTDPLLTAWELLPCSFIVEWFTNVRDFVEQANARLKQVVGKIARPIDKIWSHCRVRLWAGCPQRDITWSSEATYSGLSSQWTYWEGTREQVRTTASGGEHVNWSGNGKIAYHCFPARLNITLRCEASGTTSVRLAKTRIRRFYRKVAEVNVGKLPTLRARVRITVGKLFSLAAMMITRRRRWS